MAIEIAIKKKRYRIQTRSEDFSIDLTIPLDILSSPITGDSTCEGGGGIKQCTRDNQSLGNKRVENAIGGDDIYTAKKGGRSRQRNYRGQKGGRIITW